MFEFHISRQVRDKYQFEEALFSITGNVILADFFMTRRFADKMNQVRQAAIYPERRSRQAISMPWVSSTRSSTSWLSSTAGASSPPSWPRPTPGRRRTWASGPHPQKFVEQFPPVAVYQGKIPETEYLRDRTTGVENTHITLEEMILLFLANENPAFSRYLELFDDTLLEEQSRYMDILKSLEDFFASQPVFGPEGQTLLDLLRAPAKASPDSLYGQLEYIRTHWGYLLKDLLLRILKGMDFYREEHRARYFGPGPSLVPLFGARELEEIERFSADLDWMPHLVLIAKSTYVWLYQLSRKYGRTISQLDEIPDVELEQLARWGITGLWLIGIWERSPASRKIKQITGNPEAAASAYSIYDYVIAGELGANPRSTTSRSAPCAMASGWRPTWSPTTWASTPNG